MRQKWTHGRMVAKMTQAEAAERLGLTRQAVQQHERSALAKLRAGLLAFEEVREIVGEDSNAETRRTRGEAEMD